MLIMLSTLISTYMQNIISIILVHNLFLAANVGKFTAGYAVRLPNCLMFSTARKHATYICVYLPVR